MPASLADLPGSLVAPGSLRHGPQIDFEVERVHWERYGRKETVRAHTKQD